MDKQIELQKKLTDYYLSCFFDALNHHNDPTPDPATAVAAILHAAAISTMMISSEATGMDGKVVASNLGRVFGTVLNECIPLLHAYQSHDIVDIANEIIRKSKDK